MDQEIKKAWVEELRSGRHEQTKGVLCTTDGKKCCLGVITELAYERGVVKEKVVDTLYIEEVGDPVDHYAYGSDEAYGVLPTEVQEWAGFLSANPRVDFEGESAPLSLLNDRFNQDFNQIADVIEEQL
jgi:hypothetical protein